MKKITYALASMLLIVSLFSCQQKNNLTFEKPAFTVTNDAQHLDIAFTRTDANANVLESINQEEEKKLLAFVNTEYTTINKMAYSTLVNFQIKEGIEKSYLIFQGYSQATKSMSSFAYEIQLNTDKTKAGLVMNKQAVSATGRIAAASDSHTCTGNPCSCCSFTTDSGGNITGCSCDQVLRVGATCYGAPSTCNHTVSTGGTVPRFGQCGGEGYTGATSCVSPYICTYYNEYYSQCL